MHSKSKPWPALARLFLLAGIFGVALSGCSRSQPTAAEVRARWMEKAHQAIKDPVRAQHVAEMVGHLLDAQEARSTALHAASDRFTTLNADYHATTDQLQAVYQEYEARQREALAKFRDDLFALRGEVSAAEWEMLAD